MTDLEFRVEMDENYFRAFHADWIAVCGPGWRKARKVGLALLLTAACMAFVGWLLERSTVLNVSMLLAGVGGWISYSLYRRREAWLTRCRALPHYGQTIRLRLHDGTLTQVYDDGRDAVEKRTAALVVGPNGYFLRWSASMPPVHEAVSITTASVYIPHRLVAPFMTREAFVQALSAPK